MHAHLAGCIQDEPFQAFTAHAICPTADGRPVGFCACYAPVSLLANNRKGDKLWNEARTEEATGNLDHALQLAEQAYELDPSDVGYQLEVRRVRFGSGRDAC